MMDRRRAGRRKGKEGGTCEGERGTGGRGGEENLSSLKFLPFARGFFVSIFNKLILSWVATICSSSIIF